MIKPVDSSSSVGNNFEDLLSNLMSKRSESLQETVTKNSENSLKSDEFEKSFDLEKLERGIKTIFNDENLAINFAKDDDTQKMILKIINQETDEVIRQYPPETSLRIARMVSELIDNGELA